MSEGNVTRIPHFVSAKTPKKLQEKMFVNNIEHQMEFLYDITHDGKQWVAWYYKPVNSSIEELVRG